MMARRVPFLRRCTIAPHTDTRRQAAACSLKGGLLGQCSGTIAHDLLSFWAELARPPQISPRTALGGASVTLSAASIASAISRLLRVFPGARRASSVKNSEAIEWAE
jgi:hypothetical protein